MRVLFESVFFKNMEANVIAKPCVAREFSYEIFQVSEKGKSESEFFSEKNPSLSQCLNRIKNED